MPETKTAWITLNDQGLLIVRVRDGSHNWRVFYRIDDDIILVFLVFAKTTRATPKRMIDLCKKRLKDFDAR